MSFEEEDCEIFLKPSTELIPDEYEHDDQESASVHVFIFKENMERKFVDCMRSLGYIVPEKNIHPLSSRMDVIATLQRIGNEANGKSCLIVLFWGLLRDDKKFLLRDGSSVKLIEIWSKFVPSNCPFLKDKAKIFIFNGVKHIENTEEDALPISRKYSGIFSYNIPAEADMLIVFKHNDDLKTSVEYMDSLCSNFQNYAQREDISSLLTIAHFSSQPTLISTMTRKFYLKPNAHRGIQLSLREKYSKIEEAIQKVKENIIYLTKAKKDLPENTEENTKVPEPVAELKRSSSIEGNLQRRIPKQDALTKFRSRSNTTSRLNDIDKYIHKRRGSADHKPAWRY
ncbi:uncharacterized protein LOC123318717 isoform X2 [Coccinella septempunctata]|uniref:uncharacterized protein LOC123318717 isoform X2 n=1 Tax=Coccinella septempunctata TaxID=41139 RepID=UPI001D08ECBD|nr:uncharacterized protein LOC123318717 isoform X2 [Coccinella septempunctata]